MKRKEELSKLLKEIEKVSYEAIDQNIIPSEITIEEIVAKVFEMILVRNILLSKTPKKEPLEVKDNVITFPKSKTETIH